MKISAVILAGVFAMAPILGSAEDSQRVTVTGSPDEGRMSGVERAMNACSREFIAEILPGSQQNVRVVNDFDKSETHSISRVNVTGQVDLALDARAAGSGKLLATARCSANRFASVKYIKTNIRDSDALAALTLKDLQLVASIR